MSDEITPEQAALHFARKGKLMTQTEIMNQTEDYVLHTYNRFPVVLDRGDGVRLRDCEGKEYLDFMSGIGVHALGYHFPGYDEALIAQIGKLTHSSNLYYHLPLKEASEKYVHSTGMAKAFFTNSGTEAIEGALKAARKYSYQKYGAGRSEIISMKDSFHGRTAFAVTVTGNEHYQEPFRPLVGGVKYADYNDLESVKALLTDKTCCIILETLQGEGGIFPAEPAFLKGIRELCDEKDLVLILDEVQCGMGRTGAMWAYEHYGVRPDIVCSAKALGCGIPVGAFALNGKLADASLAPGDHGTTYGGNPFAMAAVSKVFDLFAEHDIVGHVNELAPYLEQKLNDLKAAHPCIREQRGMGLMRGLQLDDSVQASSVASRALEKGLLVITAGHNVLRLLPPLVITAADVDEAVSILDLCFL